MSYKTVDWYSGNKKLPCASCDAADVLLFVRPELIAPKVCPLDPMVPPEITGGTNYAWQTIKASAVLLTFFRNPCGVPQYKYRITYDDLQLVPDTTLGTSDISAVLCDGALTHYVQEQVGEEIKVEIIPAAGSDPEMIRLTTQHGCQFEWPNGAGTSFVQTPITAEDTTTIDTDSFGTDQHTIRSAVKLDPTAGNILHIAAGGLRVDCASIFAAGCGAGGEIQNTFVNTSTIQGSATGTLNRTISAAVKVSATGGNAIAVNADGLYVPAATETPNSATDSSTIDFTLSGASNRAITGAVKVSAVANNSIVVQADGLWVAADTPNSGSDSNSIDIVLSGTLQRNLVANAKISAAGGNIITIAADGLYVPNSSADVISGSIPVAGPINISSIVYTTYGQTGAVSLFNPSATKSMKWLATFHFASQAIMDGAGQTGIWEHGGEVNINSAGWVNYTLDIYGSFPDGPVGLPWRSTLSLVGLVAPGGTVVLEARQTVKSNAAGTGSSIIGGSTNFTAIGVTI